MCVYLTEMSLDLLFYWNNITYWTCSWVQNIKSHKGLTNTGVHVLILWTTKVTKLWQFTCLCSYQVLGQIRFKFYISPFWGWWKSLLCDDLSKKVSQSAWQFNIIAEVSRLSTEVIMGSQAHHDRSPQKICYLLITTKI